MPKQPSTMQKHAHCGWMGVLSCIAFVHSVLLELEPTLVNNNAAQYIVNSILVLNYNLVVVVDV